jgi:23S rRNA pseudouridine2605 synthase
MSEMRLQKFLAEAGVASRRKAEELIKSGHVKVNGDVTCEMGVKVSREDWVELDDRPIRIEGEKVYVMLNKPEGFVTTVKDQFARPTVLDLVKEFHSRIYPVGRLDYDTSGLLLLTNDGDFTYTLTHPKNEKKKVYEAEVKGVPEKESLMNFEKGLKIEDYVTSPAKVKLVKKEKNSSVLRITIHEGRNRQVRKMCAAIGHPVIKLARVAFGGLELGNLTEGKWRCLTENEVRKLIN